MNNTSFAKLVVWINALVPLTILCWDALNHNLGADPTKFALHTTGMLALYAFFYACIHLSIYFVFDRELSFSSLFSEVGRRPFILYGMTALVLMIPLAATSTNASIKRLGAARWKRVHQLAYVSGIAG